LRGPRLIAPFTLLFLTLRCAPLLGALLFGLLGLLLFSSSLQLKLALIGLTLCRASLILARLALLFAALLERPLMA
jgi:hypothetical protein